MTAKTRKILAIVMIVCSVILLLSDVSDSKQILKTWAVGLDIGLFFYGLWFYVLAKREEKKLGGVSGETEPCKQEIADQDMK